MSWRTEFHADFLAEFEEFGEAVQDNILAKALVLQQFGPQLGRPHVDTLSGSRFANMKELRLDIADGAWRVAFAFDPERNAILLVAGDKAGKNQNRFYARLIRKADRRFTGHLKEVVKRKKI